MDLIDSFGGWLWSFTSTNTSTWHAWNNTHQSDTSIVPFDDLVNRLAQIANTLSRLDKNAANSVGFLISFLFKKFKTLPIEDGSFDLWPTDSFIWYGITWFFLSGLIGLMVIPFIMSVIGFGVDGVSPYSCASCTQRRVYGEKTGCYFRIIKNECVLDGCFSKLQSLGTRPRRLMVIGFFFGAIIGEFIAMKIYIQYCCTLTTIAEHFLSKLHD